MRINYIFIFDKCGQFLESFICHLKQTKVNAIMGGTTGVLIQEQYKTRSYRDIELS